MMIRVLIVIGCFASLGCNDSGGVIAKQRVLVFGEAYGFCGGDCAHFYKLEDNKLYADVENRYSESLPDFSAVPLEEAKFNTAKSLLNNFPEYLLNNPNKTFGCPDCADQGGIHLYYKEKGEVMFWHIDTFEDNQPQEIRTYIMQVRTILDQLEN